jgi:hypothetical protein
MGQLAAISEKVAELFDRHNAKSTRPSQTECSTILQSLFRAFSKVFIVVDALDECSKNDRDTLLSSLQIQQPDLRVLLTSRPDVTNIGGVFPETVRVEMTATDDDIKLYLDGRIERDSRLRLLVQDSTLHDTITKEIIANSKGM